MKKTIILILSMLLICSLSIPAAAAEEEMTLSAIASTDQKTVTLTVTLTEKTVGDAIGITYTYDANVLKPIHDKCKWIPESALSDFSTTEDRGVWAAAQPMDLKGDVCVLTFQVLDGKKLSSTSLGCVLEIRNGSTEVGEFRSSTTLSGSCTHSYNDWENQGELGHRRVCQSCGKSQTQSHSWDSGVTKTEANGSSSMVYTCTVCKHTRSEQLTHTPNSPQQTSPTEPTHNVPEDPTRPQEDPVQPTKPQGGNSQGNSSQGGNSQGNTSQGGNSQGGNSQPQQTLPPVIQEIIDKPTEDTKPQPTYHTEPAKNTEETTTETSGPSQQVPPAVQPEATTPAPTQPAPEKPEETIYKPQDYNQVTTPTEGTQPEEPTHDHSSHTPSGNTPEKNESDTNETTATEPQRQEAPTEPPVVIPAIGEAPETTAPAEPSTETGAAPVDESNTEQKTSIPGTLIVVLLLLVAAAGGTALYLWKKKKPSA